jgi:fluoride exporter
MKLIYLALGAVLGAWGRYGVGILLQRFVVSDFPWATFLVNVLGAFCIGFLLPHFSKNIDANLKMFAVTGFLGAFTTFSAFSVEVLHLIQKEKSDVAFLYIGLSLICGFLFVFLGSFMANR